MADNRQEILTITMVKQVATHTSMLMSSRFWSLDVWSAVIINRLWIIGGWAQVKWYIGNEIPAQSHDWKIVNAWWCLKSCLERVNNATVALELLCRDRLALSLSAAAAAGRTLRQLMTTSDWKQKRAHLITLCDARNELINV
jgi:hypothetical protein